MCKASSCQLSALNVQNFAGHISSRKKFNNNKKRTKFDDNLLQQLIVLRINREFMEFARHNRIASSTHIIGIADEVEEIVEALI